MRKGRMERRIILVLMIFSAIVIAVVTSMLYLNLKMTVASFNKSIMEENKKIILETLVKTRSEGVETINKSINKVIFDTREKINKFTERFSKENNNSILKLFSKTLSQELEFKSIKLLEYSRNPLFMWEKYQREKEMLQELLKKDNEFKGFMVYGDTGFPVFRVGELKEDFDLKNVIKKTKNMEIYYSKILGEGHIYLAVPIFNDENIYKGFIISRIELKNVVQKLFTEV